MTDKIARPDDAQHLLFEELSETFHELWDDMPEFVQKDATSFDRITVHFRTPDDRRKFLELVGESPERRLSIWYPKMEIARRSVKGYEQQATVPSNEFPIYVISKGRWQSRYTVKALGQLGLPFYLVVEPVEFESYASAVDVPSATILQLPFSDLGQGSIPARNWVWDHAISIGAKRHWILDDNIKGFYRLNRNEKIKIVDDNPFAHIERWVSRYENVALAGMHYSFFASQRDVLPPLRLNRRIYSCILIDNALPFRWRGRYNEDTDLSLRVLKSGMVTALFNAFLIMKESTMTMKGGNTDELYKDDGRLLMAESLAEQHPDVVKVTTKWGRPQHEVDYRSFKKNQLKPRATKEPKR